VWVCQWVAASKVASNPILKGLAVSGHLHCGCVCWLCSQDGKV
jgi:hypothetical protein